jgi:N-acetylmuramoyl-L-alanine amidase
MRLRLLLLLILSPVVAQRAAAWPPDHASAVIPPRPAAVAMPPIAGPPGRPLVVIDPGHGGHDPGSSARTGIAEKAVALAIARAIRDGLAQDGTVRVALTRNDDRWLGLAARREIARTMDAALFLSIHCDSTADPAIHGASLYTLADRPSDPAAGTVAARENRADAGAGGTAGADLSALLTGLAERETRAHSRRFALLLGRALRPTGTLKPDWARAARLKVLRAPDMPSVLMEVGYLSDPGDLRRLSSPAGRRAITRAVTTAVRAYVAGGN